MLAYLPWVAAMAALLSIAARYGASWSWSRLFLEEETMNLCLIILMVFSGPIIRLVLLGCLAMWAFVECCQWGSQILSLNPNATGVVLLQPVIKLGNLYRVEIIQWKNHIELFVGFLSMFMVLTSRCAPIFPVFYWQYIRVKYVINYFTKTTFTIVDDQILHRLFPGSLYSLIVEPAKKIVKYVINFQ